MLNVTAIQENLCFFQGTLESSEDPLQNKQTKKNNTTILLTSFYAAVLAQATHISLFGNQDLLFSFKTSDFSSGSAGLSLPQSTDFQVLQVFICHGNVLKDCANISGEVVSLTCTASLTNYKNFGERVISTSKSP